MNTLQQLSRSLLQRVFSLNRNMREIVRVLPPDAIEAIENPVFVAPENAVQMAVEEPVIGLACHGKAKAYPVKVLTAHEIVNDVVAGLPVAVTWSPLSFSATVFRRSVNGKLLTFGNAGCILRNVPVLHDRETGTYWNQLTGKGFNGPLQGQALEHVQYVLSTWESWLGAYPDTVVLSKEKSPYNRYEEDHMADYYGSAQTGIRPPAHKDNRLHDKEIVLGSVLNGTAAAYPFSLLQNAKVLHDQLNGTPVIAFYETEAEAAVLYRAELDGATLSFYEKDGCFFDCLTGSRWSVLHGRAVEGPLKGKKLVQLPATTAFWFAWADHYPQCSLYTLPNVH